MDVSNDLMGNYSFTIRLGAQMVKPRAVDLYLNTDQDEHTGSPSGAEYLVSEHGHEDDWEFLRWDGSEWVWNRMAGVTGAAKGNVVDFTIRKSDLGGVRHFDFFVLSYRDDRIDDRDDGPSGGSGMWHYDFREGFRLLNVRSFVTVPNAGGRWRVGIRAERSDNGAAVASGKIRCVGSAGTLILRTTGSGFTNRGGQPYAFCEFAIPKALKGSWVGARVDLTSNGATATKILSSTGK